MQLKEGHNTTKISYHSFGLKESSLVRILLDQKIQ